MVFSFRGSQQLKQEITQWADEGIISREQENLLFERYDLLRSAPWYAQSGFILKAVALVLGGFGFLLLISENWNSFPLFLRVSIGAIPLFFSYAAGLHFFLQKREQEAELALFFAGILFGVNIFLQAQIFHISAYFPNGVLWWCLGVLPFAWILRSSLHNILAFILFMVWSGMQLEFRQFSWLSPLIFATLLAHLYRFPSKTSVILASFSLTYFFLNIESAFASYEDSHRHIFLYMAISAALSRFSLDFVAKDYPESLLKYLQSAAMFFVALPLYVHSFQSSEVLNISFSAVEITAVFLAFGLFLLNRKSQSDIAAFALFAFVLLMFMFRDFSAPFANIALISYAVWSIIFGMRKRFKSYFMRGIQVVFVMAISRYFDFFNDYTLMAFIFFAFAILLFVLNSLWNKHYAN